jgi:hypothetical protein
VRRQLHAGCHRLSESDDSVSCETHGSTPAALVCRHLPQGAQLGFNYRAERDADQVVCPDAWCDACHEALERAGHWDEAMLAHAGFAVVCQGCYGEIRAKNWPQDHLAWQSLVKSSVDYLSEQQAVLMRDFRLGEHQRYDWDQERAELVFSNDGKPALVCDIVMVGSISVVTGTWLWSWANDSDLEQVKAPLRDVLAFGEERGFEKLAGAYWPGAEEDGWQMTAIAAKYLGAIGAYRTPKERGFTFMAITRARWVQ